MLQTFGRKVLPLSFGAIGGGNWRLKTRASQNHRGNCKGLLNRSIQELEFNFQIIEKISWTPLLNRLKSLILPTSIRILVFFFNSTKLNDHTLLTGATGTWVLGCYFLFLETPLSKALNHIPSCTENNFGERKERCKYWCQVTLASDYVKKNLLKFWINCHDRMPKIFKATSFLGEHKMIILYIQLLCKPIYRNTAAKEEF